MSASPNAVLALALLRLEGVGRVTAGRLLARFPSFDALRATPREQVLLRLRRTAHAEDLVARLFGPPLEKTIAEAERYLEALAQRRIEVLTEHHPHWPTGLADLDRSDRPVVLYAFGDTAVLSNRAVALLARPPLDGPSYETSQVLVRRLLEVNLPPASGLQHGFDTVVHKLAAGAGQPSVMVASAGIVQIPKPMRPIAAAAVQAGGVLVSPFPPDHGPFAHDDVERARLLVALSRASAFFSVHEDSAEQRALGWALEHDRPTFGTSPPEAPPLPDRVHRLERPLDLDWVIAAARAEANG